MGECLLHKGHAVIQLWNDDVVLQEQCLKSYN